MIAVVLLDDQRSGAGPGTVLEVSIAPVRAILERYTDRDGARPASLRLWKAFPNCTAGDRVSLSEEP